MSRISPVRHAWRLARDSRGATIVEFAFVAPVLVLFLMFLFDTGYYLYVKAILTGEVQVAGRGSGLETATQANRDLLDQRVETAIKRIVSGATVRPERMSFRNYARAQSTGEEFVDTNKDGICNNEETFYDDPSGTAGQFDANLPGVMGQGGAKDVVIYTVTVEYDRLFPMASLLGWNNQVTMKSSTILRNQPFDKQAEPKEGKCPP